MDTTLNTSLLYTCLACSVFTFVSIALKAANSKSVQYNRYLLIPPTSYMLQLVDLLNYVLLVKQAWAMIWWHIALMVLCTGTGAWMGTFCGIYLQAWLVKKLYKIEAKK